MTYPVAGPYRDAAERARRYVSETRREYVSRGLCPYCYGLRPATPGKEACDPCREERNRRYNERRRQRIEAGLCYKCGAPLDGGATMCRECCRRQVERSRTFDARQKARGNCRMCGQPSDRPERCYCSACQEKHRAAQAARYRAHQARRPGCEHHWCVRIRVLEGIRAGKLRALWRQWCPDCRKAEQHRIYVEPERLAEVLSWSGKAAAE